nr:uncharacterized protein LOC124818745 isoform X2 [Hydra vulgaris]
MQVKSLSDISEIDKNIKNKFRWNWLQEKDYNDEHYSAYITKINKAGAVRCTICNKDFYYGSEGKKSLLSHSKSKMHRQNCAMIKSNEAIPSSFFTNLKKKDMCILPYGTPDNVHIGSTCTKRVKPTIKPIVSFRDRTSNAEAMTLTFICEHNLPISLTSHMIEYAKEMSKDHRVLKNLKMFRTTASYKLREGLGEAFHAELVFDMKIKMFSLNIDECFSAKNEKVLSILLAYFCDKTNKVVLKHYASLSLVTVNAESLFNAVIYLTKTQFH